MKKKKIIGVVIISLFAFIFTGCFKKEVNNNDFEEMDESLNNVAYEQGEDGWIYYLKIEYPGDEGKSIDDAYYYLFEGVNTKYKNIDDFEESQAPFLSSNPKYSDKIIAINEYLSKEKFDREITVADLEEVDTGDINKEMIVRLYNQALTSNHYSETGKYKDLPETDTIKENEAKDGYVWQVNYINNYGYLQFVDIELIFTDGTSEVYLSDKVNDKTVTEDEKQIQKSIDELEKKIVEEQNFMANASVSNVDFSRLQNILKYFDGLGISTLYEN